MAVRAHEKGLELVYQHRLGVPEYVIGDPSRLRQILTNLIGNAIKFTPRGEVVLTVSRLSRIADRLELRFDVCDTGIGIPPEKQSLIFEAFAQADASTTRSFGGSGLGLAICSRLTSLLGGRIWLESAVGKGSKFHFTAQFAAARTQETAPTPGQERLVGKSVIIVEENPTTLATLIDLALGWNMNVTAMHSTESALVRMQAMRAAGLPFAFAWVRADMPGMTGYELAQAAEEQHLAAAVLLMLTLTSQAGNPVQLQKFRSASRLLKPVRRSELLTAMLGALDGAQRAASSSLLPPRHTQSEVRSLRIMVAEDTPVNQVLISRTLEKMGHTVTIANTGRECLDFLKTQSFHLIFMDVQMPEMDGLTATRAIRVQEKETGSHIPIVAMTAHTMKGDRERCLESGMDDYLAKPVSSREIADAIKRIFPLSPAAAAPSSRSDRWTVARALEQVEGDEKLLHEVIAIFVDEAPKLLAKLRQAIASRDIELLERTAHNLKGQLAYLGVTVAAQKSRELEDSGQRGDLPHARRIIDEVEKEITEVMESMRQVVQHENPDCRR